MVGQQAAQSLGEKLLLRLSKSPGSPDFRPGHVNYTLDTALSLLCRVFPDFMKSIAGKEILDFGCGSGYQAVSLALKGAKRVVGLDSNAECLSEARKLAAQVGLADRVRFIDHLDDSFLNRFEVIISKDSMEHYPDPSLALHQMQRVLKKDGILFITFGPPWLAPYGGHMHFFTKLPWVHLLFTEATVLKVRARFRSDGARRYQDVEGGLNKMTVAKFERLVSQSRLKVLYRNHECVKGITLPAKLPGIREFFINQVSYVLAKVM